LIGCLVAAVVLRVVAYVQPSFSDADVPIEGSNLRAETLDNGRKFRVTTEGYVGGGVSFFVKYVYKQEEERPEGAPAPPLAE
jgi:hypothetical protein